MGSPGATTAIGPHGIGRRITLYVTMLRPQQWLKSVLVFLVPLYARQWSASDVVHAALAAIAFSLLSSGVYVVNDILDRERDREHPRKRLRPLAAGMLSTGDVWPIAVAAIGVGGLVAFGAGLPVLVVAAVYVANSMLYTVRLKHVPLLDVLSLAAGFIIRVWAGGAAVGVSPGLWLVSCVGAGALLLSTGKRRHELSLGAGSHVHRPSLTGMDAALLDQLTTIFAATTLLLYALAIVEAPFTRLHPLLMLTAGPVLFGVMRYLLLYQGGLGTGEPDRLLVRDSQLRWTVIVWFAMTVGALLA